MTFENWTDWNRPIKELPVLEPGHFGTGTLWNWDILEPGHYGTGTFWNWDTLEPGHLGTGTFGTEELSKFLYSD